MKTLQEFYDSLPKIDCTGECADYCTVAPLGVSEEEYIAEKYGEDAIPEPNADLSCSALTSDGRCSIHDRRPLICRLFGLVKKMRCPYGCTPEKWVPEHKAQKLMDIIIKDRVNEEKKDSSR